MNIREDGGISSQPLLRPM